VEKICELLTHKETFLGPSSQASLGHTTQGIGMFLVAFYPQDTNEFKNAMEVKMSKYLHYQTEINSMNFMVLVHIITGTKPVTFFFCCYLLNTQCHR
jgi:hypothetical protein